MRVQGRSKIDTLMESAVSQRDWKKNLMKKLFQRFAICGFLSFLLACGCGKPKAVESESNSEKSTTPPPANLTVLFVDDDGLSGDVSRQWSARTGGEMKIETATSEEILSAPLKSRYKADAIVYPPALMGDLLKSKSLNPVSSKRLRSPEFAREQILRHDRTTLVEFGKETFAVSFGNPIPMLMIRTDVLQALELEPPKTWSEFSLLCETLRSQKQPFTDDSNQELPTAIAVPTGKGWAAQLALSRAIPYIRQSGRLSTMFEAASMEPLIASPPFQRSLREWVADLKSVPGELTPKDCFEQIVTGKAAVAIGWPSAAWNSDLKADPVPLSIDLLPTSNEFYRYRENQWQDRDAGELVFSTLSGCSGRVVSMTSFSRNRTAAGQFLTWISNKEINDVLSPKSPVTLLIRDRQLDNPYRWSDPNTHQEFAQQYADAIRRYHGQTTVVRAIRIPGQSRYLKVLDQNVLAAIRGEKEVNAALSDVERAWEQITQDLGRDSQTEFFQKSIGVR